MNDSAPLQHGHLLIRIHKLLRNLSFFVVRSVLLFFIVLLLFRFLLLGALSVLEFVLQLLSEKHLITFELLLDCQTVILSFLLVVGIFVVSHH